MIGFDACLMGQIEVFGSLYPYSNYMIASEEVIPGYGWSYAAWLAQVAQNPAMDGSGLSRCHHLHLCGQRYRVDRGCVLLQTILRRKNPQPR